MEITTFTPDLLNAVYDIQRKAYKPLYEKYHDDLNPYTETKETVLAKYTRPNTTGYVFFEGENPVGACRIIETSDVCKVAAMGVLPEYQGKGIAQKAMLKIEKMHSSAKKWVLDTIMQEAGNCHLYEKLSYVRIGEPKIINENLTLVDYEKRKD